MKTYLFVGLLALWSIVWISTGTFFWGAALGTTQPEQIKPALFWFVSHMGILFGLNAVGAFLLVYASWRLHKSATRTTH